MEDKSKSRRNFLKTMGIGAAGVALASTVSPLSAKSYKRILGANDRITVAIQGLGRRYGAFLPSIVDPKNNVELLYLCDVMDHQLEKAVANVSKRTKDKFKAEKDIRKILEDKSLDAVFMATPDHWHAPGACMAMQAGKHVYLEKPCSHNPKEGEMLVAFQKHYNRVVQMGNQQRSSVESTQIINDIHNGIIGTAYKAVAFYSNQRGEVPLPKVTGAPTGLDWDLFQGPSPRKPYAHDTWDYNWHWYGWDFGTAEMGNNATHELDIARWALDVKYPKKVDVWADKMHFKNDGWEMYDTMEANFHFDNNRVIQWDGKSRNSYKTYGAGRGTIIYGTEGSVFIDRSHYKLYDRSGKLVKEVHAGGKAEDGTKLGGGGDLSTRHAVNFFNAIRGNGELTSPIEQGAISQMLTHYANIAYRVGKGFEVDTETGRIYDRDAMELWNREYEPGWEPKL
jgi:predicted dehydrogenase